jgi:hypothetical protein
MQHGNTNGDMSKDGLKIRGLDKAFQVDSQQVQDHLGQVVKQSVEETINALLDAEADQLCKAGQPPKKTRRRTASKDA